MDGLYNGIGYLSTPKFRYEGSWKDSKMHGKAKINFTDGTYFEGEYVEGLREGLGTMIYSSGERYKGEFRDDIYHGKGSYSCLIIY